MKDLKGIYSALLIPFDEKGEVKEEGLRQVIEHNLNVCGVDGLYVNGSSGENFLLNTAQKKQIFKFVKEVVGDRAKLIAQVGSLDLNEAVELAKYATELGEEVIDDDFGYGSTDTGNVSHVVPTIHPHIKIGSRNLVGHTHRFREAAASLQGDQALIRGAKILALMGLELIENKPLLDEIIEEHTHIKWHVK